MAYATVPELLTQIGHADAIDIALEGRLEAALDAATTAIDNDTGRSFTATTATYTFGSSGGCVLHLPDFTAVTTLKVDDDDDGVFETTITDYELDTASTAAGWPFDTIRLLDRSFPTGGRRRRRVEVAGTWGWSAVPAPIHQACMLLAGRVAQRSSSALFGVQSFGDSGVAFIRSQDPDYRALIGPYVRPQVA